MLSVIIAASIGTTAYVITRQNNQIEQLDKRICHHEQEERTLQIAIIHSTHANIKALPVESC